MRLRLLGCVGAVPDELPGGCGLNGGCRSGGARPDDIPGCLGGAFELCGRPRGCGRGAGCGGLGPAWILRGCAAGWALEDGAALGGPGAVVTGSSVSEDDDEDEDDELEDCGLLAVPVGTGASSASGSSRLAVVGVVLIAGRAAAGAEGIRTAIGMSGGGSSICMCCAPLSSAAVGMAPRSMYREPVRLLWLKSPASFTMS